MTDLSVFEAENDAAGSRRVNWNEREVLVHREFPESVEPPWEDTLDDATLERVLQDILKHEQQEPGRDGPLPNLDWDKGIQSWRELTGQDFTGLPFWQAFRLLAYDISGPQSMSVIARKTGLSRPRVHRLITGEVTPGLDAILAVAAAYKKKPGFFAEYRAQVIAKHISVVLTDNPEFSANMYRRVMRRAR